jgi:hypothetical protein
VTAREGSPAGMVEVQPVPIPVAVLCPKLRDWRPVDMKIHNTQRGGRILANHKPFSLILPALVVMMIFASVGSSFDLDEAQNLEALGTTACSAAKNVHPVVQLHPIKPWAVFRKSGYGTSGVALRNRGAGGISISGVIAPVKAAYVYWAVITPGAPPRIVRRIRIQRQFPTPVSATVTLVGTAVGSGPPPCWPGAVITVFRAAIPAAVATGNGLYEVSLLAGAGGLINGSDPWLSAAVLPLWEGASIVMIGDPNGIGTPTVSVYDMGLAGTTFTADVGLAYPLMLPAAAPGVRTLFDNIGADGQHTTPGLTRGGLLSLSSESTIINGFPTAGPGSGYNDSDWNGSSGFPIPELWDDTGHDITPATPPGTGVLNVSISNGGLVPADCLTTVANVVETD